MKRSFGVYSDNSAQSQENRFLRRLSQGKHSPYIPPPTESPLLTHPPPPSPLARPNLGVNVSQNVLRNASPFVPDILGVKTGLNLVSEIPSVVKMLGSADKNDLVGKMSLSIPIRRDKQNIKYRWKVPKSVRASWGGRSPPLRPVPTPCCHNQTHLLFLQKQNIQTNRKRRRWRRPWPI